MAYQKTAKDLAWDKERQKLKGEIAQWVRVAASKTDTINHYKKRVAELESRIEELETAIIDLTEGSMTPDEAVKNMRKKAELADMLTFLTNGIRGMY